MQKNFAQIKSQIARGTEYKFKLLFVSVIGYQQMFSKPDLQSAFSPGNETVPPRHDETSKHFKRQF